MDDPTLRSYDADAGAYAAEWEDEQDAPNDLYNLLETFFTRGTAVDIGCGSGRDTAWLAEHGFEVEGYDASTGLLEQARRRHPGIPFARATLPDLAELGARTFANVLCETVIMHLPPTEIRAAVRRLASLLPRAGTLYLSWRTTSGDDLRDPKGRLYAAFPDTLVLDELTDVHVLLDEEQRSASSGKVVRRLVIRRPD